MRTFIRLLVVLAVCLVVIGFCRGWFSLSSPKPDAGGEKIDVTVSVDKGKIRSDVKRAEEKVKEEVKELEGKVKAKEAKK